MSWRSNVSSRVFVCGCVLLLFLFSCPLHFLFGSVMQHLDTHCYLKLYSVSISVCQAFVAVLYLTDSSLTHSSVELRSGEDDMKTCPM